jgi:hypothetical protein
MNSRRGCNGRFLSNGNRYILFDCFVGCVTTKQFSR